MTVKPLRDTAAIARREWGAFVHEPIAWVLAVLFLVVQGAWFHAIVKLLADPWRPAPYGAAMHVFFGGTTLYWTFLFFVCAAVTMRLVADERRRGTWETLRTAPVGEGAIVVGKWIAALGFYLLLWLPTLAYPLILRAFAPPNAGLDVGPIVAAYVGIALTGAAFLAVGVFASSVTSNQTIAATLTFAILLLLGVAREIAPASLARSQGFDAVAGAFDARAHMHDFARGLIDWRPVGVYAAVAATALVAAVAVIRSERRRRHARGAALGTLLVAASTILANVWIARHPARIDLTAGRVYSLAPRTKRILGDVRHPVRALIIRPSVVAFEPIYDDARRLLRTIAVEQPLVEIEELDLARQPARAEELARAHALRLDELKGGGAIVFSSLDRVRAVGLLDMAEIGIDPEVGGGRVQAFHGEERFAAAILEVTDRARPEVCFTTGHGEPPVEPSSDGRDLAALAELLARDGARVTELRGAPDRCDAVAIVGPTRPFSADEAIAFADYLARGGRLFVALDPVVDERKGGLASTGLEALLDGAGVRLGGAVVLDPSRGAPEMPLGWRAVDGYGRHPISAAFEGRRDTLWLEPRWIAPRADAPGVAAVPLISSSGEAWGETEVAALGRRRPNAPDDRDVPGPLAIAVAAERASNGSRVVVLGSARSLATDIVDLGTHANDAFAASSIAWLTGRTKLVAIGAKTPEQLRLSLTPAQLSRTFWISVVAIPAVVGAAGAMLRRRRRRS